VESAPSPAKTFFGPAPFRLAVHLESSDPNSIISLQIPGPANRPKNGGLGGRRSSPVLEPFTGRRGGYRRFCRISSGVERDSNPGWPRTRVVRSFVQALGRAQPNPAGQPCLNYSGRMTNRRPPMKPASAAMNRKRSWGRVPPEILAALGRSGFLAAHVTDIRGQGGAPPPGIEPQGPFFTSAALN